MTEQIPGTPAEPEADPDAERSRRIEATVQRDLARRRRLVRLYLALLVVPLAVAARLMLFGRSERAAVDQAAEKAVDAKVARLAPMGAALEREWASLAPRIRGVDERFASYERGQEELAEQVSEVSAEVRQIEPALADAREVKAEVDRLRRDYSAQQRELTLKVEALGTRIGPASGDPRRPAGGDLRPADPRVAGQVEDLERRIRELEGSVARLQREARTLRTELDRVTRNY
jgi:chromosome segregation ATPase